MEKTHYSSDYLETIRERFPEYTNITNEELVTVLDNNTDRQFGVYEYQVESALKDLQNQVVFDNNQDFFGMIPQSMSDRLDSGLTYILTTKNGYWDLVLGVRDEKSTWGWQSTVWAPVPADRFSFVVDTTDKNYLSPSEDKKMVLTISISPRHQQDSLGRPIFSIVPKLVEIPSKNALMMAWFLFSKDLTSNEFSEELAKFVS